MSDNQFISINELCDRFVASGTQKIDAIVNPKVAKRKTFSIEGLGQSEVINMELIGLINYTDAPHPICLQESFDAFGAKPIISIKESDNRKLPKSNAPFAVRIDPNLHKGSSYSYYKYSFGTIKESTGAEFMKRAAAAKLKTVSDEGISFADLVSSMKRITEMDMQTDIHWK